MDVNFLMKIFRLYLKVKSKGFHDWTQKNQLLSACYFCDGAISLRELDQKFARWKIGYGDSYLDSVVRYAKVFRLHATYTMLLEQFDYKPVMDLATATLLVKIQTVVCLVTWLDYFFAFT